MSIRKSERPAWTRGSVWVVLIGALAIAPLAGQDTAPPAPVPPPVEPVPAVSDNVVSPKDPAPEDDAVAPTAPLPTLPSKTTPTPAPAPMPEPEPALPPADAPSVVPENPYQAISRRNPFGLLPPPPPVKEDLTPPVVPPPPVNVRLSGYTDLKGRKKAFLVLTEQGPNKQPKSKALYEGERESGVEVLSIDFKTRAVKVNNNGFVTNLTFAKLEASSMPPPMNVPGQTPGQHRVLPNMQGGQLPGGQQPPANPLSASTDSGGSVIVGGSSGGDESPVAPNRRGGVFVSGANGATTTGGNTAANTYNPSTGGISSGTPGVNTNPNTPARPPRTGTPRYTPPIPPPLPDPRGGR